MKEEITRIMRLVKEGKLSPEDAAELIEAFSEAPREDAAQVEEPVGAGVGARSDEPGGPPPPSGKKEEPFGKFIGSIEKMTKDLTSTIDWKEIGQQVKEGVGKGVDAIKKAAEEAGRSGGPFKIVFGAQRKKEYELPLEVPAGKVFRIEGGNGDVSVTKAEGAPSLKLSATFRAMSDDDAEEKANAFTPMLEESDHTVVLRLPEGHDASVAVTAGVQEGVHVEVKMTSGDVTVSGTGGAARVTTTSGDVSLSGLDGTVEVHSSKGDVCVADTKASILTVESTAGDISLRGTSGVGNLRTSNGDVEVKSYTGRTLSVETASGDIEVDMLEPVRGALNLRTVNGDISIEVADGSDCRVSLSTLRGGVGTTLDLIDSSHEHLTITGRLGDGSGMIDASAVNGDVRLGLRDSSDDS